MNDFEVFTSMAAKQAGSDLISQPIPRLTPLVKGADNNLAAWLAIILGRWKSCATYNKASMAALVNTIKQQAGELRGHILHKESLIDIWKFIQMRVLNGHGAVRDLFNMTGPSHQPSLDVGKCIDSMETFLEWQP